jgi:NADH-quinone oxidoreductase subunit J
LAAFPEEEKEVSVFDVVFWVIALLAVGSAIVVVLTRNIFRAALVLILCFFAVAGLFIMLQADFLAGAQVLIYVGAVSILIIMSLMLTQDYWRANQPGRLRLPALVVSILLLGVVALTVVTTSWQISTKAPVAPTTSTIGQQLFGSGFILPVEISAVLLLAAILGAVVLLRDK